MISIFLRLYGCVVCSVGWFDCGVICVVLDMRVVSVSAIGPDFKKWGGREVRIWMEQSGFTEEECKVADSVINVDRIMKLLLTADSERIEAIHCSDSTKNKLAEEARKSRGQSQHAAEGTGRFGDDKVKMCMLLSNCISYALQQSSRGCA